RHVPQLRLAGRGVHRRRAPPPRPGRDGPGMTSITRHRSSGSAGMPRTGTKGSPAPASEWTLASVGEWLRSPVAPYYLVLTSGAILTALGLVMVLSASGPRSFVDSGSSYTVFL